MPSDIRKSITFVGTPPGLARLPLPLHLAVNMTTSNSLVEWYWKKWGENPVPAPLRPPQNPQGANPSLIPIYLQETPASNSPSHGKAKETQHMYSLETWFLLHREHDECLLQAFHFSRLSEIKTDEGTILRTNIFGSFRPFRNASGKGEYQLRCVCAPVRPLR